MHCVCNAFATHFVDRNMPISPSDHFGGVLRVMDCEGHERHCEILALVKMMQYADQIASDLDTPQAVFLIKAAQEALLSVLKTECAALSNAHLGGLVSDAHGHC